MSSPLLGTEGAVEAEFPDVGVPAHYGDPFAEQRALSVGAAVVDRSNLDVVTISGPDRLSWLNSLSTQKIDDLAPGVAATTLILSPHGHVEHFLSLVDDGARTWIHVEPGEADQLVEFLQSMRFMLRVEIADVSAEYAVLTLMGPERAPAPPGAVVLDFGYGADLIVDRASVAATARETARLAGITAHEALRIAGHRARFGTDTDHRTIPHEAGWI
ncbi:MAG TPA: folate-binding protein, partial [Streptosporangiaceae bacterium]|nr:folate-binding protein [Streptosporangiaceae bacterium]